MTLTWNCIHVMESGLVTAARRAVGGRKPLGMLTALRAWEMHLSLANWYVLTFLTLL